VRWAPIAVGLLFLACALVWLGNDSLASRHGYEPGSSLSTAPDGLALARAYLSRQGTDVTTLGRPISRLEPAASAVVFRVVGAPRPRECRGGACPDAGVPLPDDDEDEDDDADAGILLGRAGDDAGVLGRSEADAGAGRSSFAIVFSGGLALDQEGFLAAGGRLVLAVARTVGPPHPETSSDKPLEKVLPLLPGVQTLDTEMNATLPEAALEDAVAVFERGGAPVVARVSVGKGDVWLLSDPDVFFNARLGKADNLALLVALAGSGRPVLFDEYAHGLLDSPGLLDLLRRWGFGPALFLLALAAVVWFWRGAVTLGPPQPWRDLRTESVDLVHALSQLYQRALRPRDALSLHHARLVHDIQLRFGLSAEAATEKARLLTEGWQLPEDTASLGKSEFQRHLDVLNKAIRRLRDDRQRRA
jgi:hypothetical protein